MVALSEKKNNNCIIKSILCNQSRKTSQDFVFSNYRNLNNGNLLLESGEILKQKWHKTTKKGMLKLTYIKAL